MKKYLALLMALVMALSLAACGGTQSDTPDTTAAAADVSTTAANAEVPAEEGTNYNGLTLTMMNTKPEITDAIEKLAKTWGDAHGVTFEIYESSNPNDTLTQKYQSGDAPVIGIVDSGNIPVFAEEHMLPLDGEEWLEYTTMAASVNGKVYGFPLTVESQCIVVNKTAVEANIGREFDPAEYATPDTFAALLEEMRGNGMENPVIILPDVWSMCGHDFYTFYNCQDGTSVGAFKLVDDIKAGKDIYDDPVFTEHMSLMVDVMKEYNINKDDPLNADHDMSILELAEGNAAFLLNGSWTWAELDKFEATDEFVIMGYPTTTACSGMVQASPTKYAVIDDTVATEEQQAAAKEFLNWLAMDDAGQSGLVNDCGMVVAFTNNPYTPSDDVNMSLMQCIADGKTFNFDPFNFPSDYRNTIAPTIQKIMADEGATSRDLADVINQYWQTAEPIGR